jgi:hypothetical protein
MEDAAVLWVPTVFRDSDGIHRRNDVLVGTPPVTDIDGQNEGKVDKPDRAVIFGVILVFVNDPVEMVRVGNRGGEREDRLIRVRRRARTLPTIIRPATSAGAGAAGDRGDCSSAGERTGLLEE